MTKFYEVKQIFGSIIVEIKEISIDKIDGTQTLVSDLTPFYNYNSSLRGYKLIDQILNSQDPYGMYIDYNQFKQFVEENKKISKKGDYIDYSIPFNQIKNLENYYYYFNKEDFCKILNLDIRNFKGLKYYKEQKLTLSRNGLLEFVKEFSSNLNHKIGKFGIYIQPIHRSGISKVEYFNTLLTILKSLEKDSKVEIKEILEKLSTKTYNFDSNGYKEYTIIELITYLDEKNPYFFLKKFVEEYSK